MEDSSTTGYKGSGGPMAEDDDSFEALLANVAANPEEVRRRITPSFVAVGDRPGAVRLSTPAGEAGGGDEGAGVDGAGGDRVPAGAVVG